MAMPVNVQLNLDCRLPVDVLTRLESELAAKGECLDYLVEKLLLAEVGIDIDKLSSIQNYGGSSGQKTIKYAEYLQTK